MFMLPSLRHCFEFSAKHFQKSSKSSVFHLQGIQFSNEKHKNHFLIQLPLDFQFRFLTMNVLVFCLILLAR